MKPIALKSWEQLVILARSDNPSERSEAAFQARGHIEKLLEDMGTTSTWRKEHPLDEIKLPLIINASGKYNFNHDPDLVRANRIRNLAHHPPYLTPSPKEAEEAVRAFYHAWSVISDTPEQDISTRLDERQSLVSSVKRNECENTKSNAYSGIYFVDQSLLLAEEAREEKIRERARRKGKDDTGVKPQMFFTFQPEAAWLGIFRDWDVQRNFYPKLKQRVHGAISGDCIGIPAAAVIGAGGSGKTVALRRLAVDLWKEGHRVLWVEEPECLNDIDIGDYCSSDDLPTIIILDEIGRMDLSLGNSIVRQWNKYSSLFLIGAGRKLPKAFFGRVRPGESLFNVDDAKDIPIILDNISKLVPGWKTSVGLLSSKVFQKVRLIHVLVVLARRVNSAPKTIEELETYFLEVLSEEINSFRESMSDLPGLTEAIIDLALFNTSNITVSLKSFVALVDFHSERLSGYTSSQPASLLLDACIDNIRWQKLSNLVIIDKQRNTVKFIHDEVGKGITEAYQLGTAKSNVSARDVVWKKVLLNFFVRKGDHNTSSLAVKNAAIARWIDFHETSEYICRLAAAGNGHHSYLDLLFRSPSLLELNLENILDILFQAAKLAPNNEFLWNRATPWLYLKFNKEPHVLLLHMINLHNAGVSCHQFTLTFLSLCSRLDLKLARYNADKLLYQTNNEMIICTCLKLLGSEAKGKAKELIENPGTSQVVIGECLTLLGSEAKEKAKELLENPRTDQAVVRKCIKLLGKEGEKKAKKLLQQDGTSAAAICACLSSLRRTAREDAERLLLTSDDINVLLACLNILRRSTKNHGETTGIKPPALTKTTRNNELIAAKLIQKWEVLPPYVIKKYAYPYLSKEMLKETVTEMSSHWHTLSLRQKETMFEINVHTPEKIQFATDILKKWFVYNRRIVTAALCVFSELYKDVNYPCNQIIDQWQREIDYLRERKRPIYVGHILKAISHPELHDQSFLACRNMLDAEARTSGYLTLELKHCADNVVYYRQWPKWDAEHIK